MSRPAIDLTGQRFGRLTAVRRPGNRGVMWECVCDCGAYHLTNGSSLRNGSVRSCGCLRKESLTRHKHSRPPSPEYVSWGHMLSRCRDPRNDNFKYYGARGITVCARWHEFKNFLADMGPKPFPGLSIDRINNDGNYEPGNCRWATASEQRKNQKRK